MRYEHIDMQHNTRVSLNDSDDQHLVSAGHIASTCAGTGADSTSYCAITQHASLLVGGLHVAHALWVGGALHVRCAGCALHNQHELASSAARQLGVSEHPGCSVFSPLTV